MEANFFAFADASPVCAVAVASMPEIFSDVWYVDSLMMKHIKIQTVEKESIQ
jgi:hypothetical protein